ncbi:MAG: hypothetical protein DBP02_00955 [gamma proteobacterium symbiont of Ctena orbiculata]|nr:MAG: hypothetical protein DBP02_00955 [gamma proteobacterium symbiont of Ctena orbiculata]
MRRWLITLFLVWLVLMSALLQGKGTSADEIQVGLLLYAAREANGDIVTNRLLITPKMLRIEQEKGVDGYILYDREADVIYSVTPEEQSILVIQPQSGSMQTPHEMRLKIERLVDFDGPEIGDSKPQHWQLIVNSEICRNVILAPGLMTEALMVYQDYLTLLANQHYLSLNAIPAEYRDPCEDAIHVFAPTLFLQKGLPVHVWDRKGNQQRLLNFSNQHRVDSSLFLLPAEYKRQPMAGIE